MPKVNVETFCPGEFEHPWFFQDQTKVLKSIRERAHELFSSRSEMVDWLNAERELFFIPASELAETGTEFTLRMSAPAGSPQDISVAVEPRCVTVHDSAYARDLRAGEKLLFSEFHDREIFRQFALTHDVTPEAATAAYDGGMLTITLPKAAVALLAATSAAAMGHETPLK